MLPLAVLEYVNRDSLSKPELVTGVNLDQATLPLVEVRQQYSGPIERVLLHVAMESEARPIIEALELVQIDVRLLNNNTSYELRNFRPNIYARKFEHIEVCLVTNGVDQRFNVEQVGSGPSIISVLKGIQASFPQLVINAGTAGGFASQQAQVGDTFLGSALVFHDRRIPISEFQSYAKGFYSVLKTNNLPNQLGLREGIISTGSSLDCTPSELEQLVAINASCKDMEGAEVARIVQAFDLPFLSIKAITDIVDKTENTTADQFTKNFDFACRQLTDKIIDLIRLLNNSPVVRLEDL